MSRFLQSRRGHLCIQPPPIDAMLLIADTTTQIGAGQRAFNGRMVRIISLGDAQKAKAWDLWLDCLSQEQIANAIGVDQKTISNWLKEKSNELENFLPPDSRQHFDI